MDAIRFIINSLLSLVFFAFLLRVILQLARADFRNAIAQAVVRVTNWLVLPLRRVIPPLGKVDLASIVAVLLVELAVIAIQLWLYTGSLPPARGLFIAALLDLARSVIWFYIIALFIYVVLSWIAPGTYSPAAALLDRICEPLVAPVRRIVPPIGGLDLSVVFVMILLGALLRLL
ncbi:MAG TPA: YggT family protein [Steroidobacteraceae bacterium]|jgi:YggT family protein|nr:YggT family protein [Steroidobacteraceae bacterium]